MQDTIVALSTPPGIGAIHIVRLSGGDAFYIAQKVIRSKLPAHAKAKLSYIYDRQGEVIDNALVIAFYAPKSYTGENMVEFHVHGNPVIASTLISELLHWGGRLAEPGEFTKRALINGKISLAQVEALHEVIYGKNIESIKAAIRGVMGKYVNEIQAIYDKILNLASIMRVDIDYPEDVELEDYGFTDRKDEMISIVELILSGLKNILKRVETGQKLREGYKIVLVGAPNVGKSSLLNALLGYERAIVSDIPGTTRDFLEVVHMIGNVPVSLIDVAGLRKARDEIEKVGIEKAIVKAKEADLLIWVIDSSKPLSSEDMQIWREFGEKISLIVLNKIDNGNYRNDLLKEVKRYGRPICEVSAKTGKGIKDLVDVVSSLLSSYEYEPIYLSARVLSHLKEAIRYIHEAKYLIETDIPEIASIDIEKAGKHIGAILGKADVSEDVLDKLFQTFCVGK